MNFKVDTKNDTYIFRLREDRLNAHIAPDLKAQLWRLVEGGIQFHGQMVVVPGLNDGDVLEQTLKG